MSCASSRRFFIGRDGNCDVVLHGASVSWLHAILSLRLDGSVQFEDANSTNGSFLFERGELIRISSTYLKPNACLQFGKERVLLAEIMQKILANIRRDSQANT